MICVVPISGGKDSQTCLELALHSRQFDAVIGLFCDTQFEHPLTYTHIGWMERFYNVPIIRITAGNVVEKVLKYKRFPGGGARFCTDELKIIPSKKFYRDFAQCVGGFEVWYGVRQQESKERERRYKYKISTELYAPHEFMPSKYPKYLSILGVKVRLPILEWSTTEVIGYLRNRLNPLYEHFDRVGCFPCLAAGDKYKKKAFNHDDTGRLHHQKVITLQSIIGKNIYTSKAMLNDQCTLCQM